MRLSHYIDNQTYRDTTELLFFHGTTTRHMASFKKYGIKIVQLKKNTKKDFGQGFYLTTNYWQAKAWGEKISVRNDEQPLVLACVIPLGALRATRSKSLIIDAYDEEWLKYITRGRFHREENPLSNDYEWIYGRCGDNITFKFDRAYTISEERDPQLLLKRIIPKQDNPYYDYDQLWLGTYNAISYIKSVEFMKGVGNFDIPIYQ